MEDLIRLLIASMIGSAAFTKFVKGGLEAGAAKLRGAYSKLPVQLTAVLALVGAFLNYATSGAPDPSALNAMVTAAGAALSMGLIRLFQNFAKKPPRPDSQ